MSSTKEPVGFISRDILSEELWTADKLQAFFF